MTAVRRRTHLRALAALLLAPGVVLAGCQSGGDPAATRQSPPPDGNKPGTTAGRSAPRPLVELPGLGPTTRSQVPDGVRQALLVTGEGRDENKGTAVLYERAAKGRPWRPGPSWPVHNALRGWTDEHRQGDLRSPIGVYGLTDAGGLLPDPGTKLTYDKGPAFTAHGTGALGEPLAGSFDYVIAINYNRKPGTTPLDWTRPLGADRGGGIWLHVDHEGPTQGCVSLKEDAMKALLRAVDPAKKPVVVMGDRASLAR
ncbi:MAG TPA: L,D-transpeptidase family protein [Streptomyces sp.]|nr:L,D-transpeptidase family protein [Streptomyces sp.]